MPVIEDVLADNIIQDISEVKISNKKQIPEDNIEKKEKYIPRTRKQVININGEIVDA